MSEIANILLVNRAIITDNDRILLLQRARDDSYNAGLWEFPGGKIDADEEPEDGLIREVFEETGLIVSVSSSVAHVETELIRSGKYEGRLYVALFYAVQRLGGDLTLSNEHGAAQWEKPTLATSYDLTLASRRALISLHKIGAI